MSWRSVGEGKLQMKLSYLFDGKSSGRHHRFGQRAGCHPQVIYDLTLLSSTQRKMLQNSSKGKYFAYHFDLNCIKKKSLPEINGFQIEVI